MPTLRLISRMAPENNHLQKRMHSQKIDFHRLRFFCHYERATRLSAIGLPTCITPLLSVKVLLYFGETSEFLRVVTSL